MSSNLQTSTEAKTYFTANMRPAPIVFERGQGCHLWDIEGHEYLDMCGGIAVLSVGHSHPTLVSAIQDQVASLMHVSNLFFNDKVIALAKAITSRTVFDRVYFVNSGAEANETLLKLARRYHYEQGDKERVQIIAMEGSFHGRTYGALSMTGQPKYKIGMAPMVGGIEHVPFMNIEAVKKIIGKQTAAVMVEPLQAEGGIHVGSKRYLQQLRELCDENGALLFYDEVQTGYGRTGEFLAMEHSGVEPDGCSLAKGIAGGFPLGAIAVKEKLTEGLPPGSHATTYGGNALGCAAGLAVLRVFDEENILDNVKKQSSYLLAGLNQLREKLGTDIAVDVRGQGLLLGLELADSIDPLALLGKLREQNLLLSLAGGKVLRFSPPLVIEQDLIEQGLSIVEQVLSDPPKKESK
ncbi:MAG: acetylornithine transaminase [Myxococcales bacterium]|nr:MAG: acetylornithine transaminase [Myxococcales bacterium]